MMSDKSTDPLAGKNAAYSTDEVSASYVISLKCFSFHVVKPNNFLFTKCVFLVLAAEEQEGEKLLRASESSFSLVPMLA